MSISLPQLSLLPNLGTMLGNLVQVTGLQSTIDALAKIQSTVKAGDFTPESIDAVLVNVKALLSSVGHFVPGGAFAQIEEEVAKYESMISSIEQGTPTAVADVHYVSKSGQRYELILSLSEKKDVATPVPVPTASP